MTSQTFIFLILFMASFTLVVHSTPQAVRNKAVKSAKLHHRSASSDLNNPSKPLNRAIELLRSAKLEIERLSARDRASAANRNVDGQVSTFVNEKNRASFRRLRALVRSADLEMQRAQKIALRSGWGVWVPAATTQEPGDWADVFH